MIDRNYCIVFDYQGEDNARDFFAKIADFLLRLDELNQILVSVFNPSIETQIKIQLLEKGSVKLWLKDAISKIDDEDIKRYVNNPKEAIIDIIIKAKKMILKALDDEKCENIPNMYENLIEKSELKAYGYGIKKTKMLYSVSKLSLAGKEFKKPPMLIIDDVEYIINKNFDYNKLKNAQNKISRIESEFIIKKPDLTASSKWELIFNKIIKVDIVDKNFINDLRERKIKLSSGDKIKGTLTIKTFIDENLEILESEYTLSDIKGIIAPWFLTKLF